MEKPPDRGPGACTQGRSRESLGGLICVEELEQKPKAFPASVPPYFTPKIGWGLIRENDPAKTASAISLAFSVFD